MLGLGSCVLGTSLVLVVSICFDIFKTFPLFINTPYSYLGLVLDLFINSRPQIVCFETSSSYIHPNTGFTVKACQNVRLHWYPNFGCHTAQPESCLPMTGHWQEYGEDELQARQIKTNEHKSLTKIRIEATKVDSFMKTEA
jgi:hypothetical protein